MTWYKVLTGLATSMVGAFQPAAPFPAILGSMAIVFLTFMGIAVIIASEKSWD